jgi:hypothetical protein
MAQPEIAFLFGAGASQGAGAIEPRPPPLGGQLYAELTTEFPDTWGGLADDEKALFARGSGTSFEEGMKLLWEKFDERAWAALIAMGRYFSRFRAPRDQSDCYSRLIIALRALGLIDSARVASLNYECILEVASTSIGVNVADEPEPGKLALSKPHGSCNFLVDVDWEHVTLVGSSEMQNLLIAPLRAVRPDEVEPRFDSGYSIPPVMSMYEPRKRTPVNTEVVLAMRGRWREWAMSAALIVIIGANPLLRDGHIWDPIFSSSAPVWYIGGTSGDDYSHFAERLDGRLERLGHRFEECLKDLLGRLRDFRDAALVIQR